MIMMCEICGMPHGTGSRWSDAENKRVPCVCYDKTKIRGVRVVTGTSIASDMCHEALTKGFSARVLSPRGTFERKITIMCTFNDDAQPAFSIEGEPISRLAAEMLMEAYGITQPEKGN